MTALPNVQNAQYGDSAKLEQLGATRITNNPAATVQQSKDMVGGRPPETDPVKLATRAVIQSRRRQQGAQAPHPEQQRYQKMFNTLAVQHDAVNKLLVLASSPSAGPMTRTYARMALQSYKDNLLKVRQQTPFVTD